MAASQHLLYLEDIRKEKYKIDLTDMKPSKKRNRGSFKGFSFN